MLLTVPTTKVGEAYQIIPIQFVSQFGFEELYIIFIRFYEIPG